MTPLLVFLIFIDCIVYDQFTDIEMNIFLQLSEEMFVTSLSLLGFYPWNIPLTINKLASKNDSNAYSPLYYVAEIGHLTICLLMK